MFLNEPSQLAQLVAAEAPSISQQNRREPELRLAFRLFDMDMRWLAILATPEVEPIAGNAQDGWHLEESTLRSAEKQGLGWHGGGVRRLDAVNGRFRR